MSENKPTSDEKNYFFFEADIPEVKVMKMVNLFMRIKTYLPFSSIVESNRMPFQLFVGERNHMEFYHFNSFILP
jgi:hypothetical protein